MKYYIMLYSATMLAGCLYTSTPSENDQITLAPAKSGEFHYVLGGNEEIKSKIVTIIYEKFSKEIHIYSESENGCYLSINANIPLKDTEIHISPYSNSYFWDSRKSSHTNFKWGEGEDLDLTITNIDTTLNLISGMFKYKVAVGGMNYRLSQGSFTSTPFGIVPDSSFNYSFSIQGESWIDSGFSYLPNNNYLIHPASIIHLDLGKFLTGSLYNNEANTYIDLPLNKITLGIHDLRSSAYTISCEILQNYISYNFPPDSLQSGNLTITKFDPLRRSISGNFQFITKDDSDRAPKEVKGTFNNIYWLDEITN